MLEYDYIYLLPIAGINQLLLMHAMLTMYTFAFIFDIDIKLKPQHAFVHIEKASFESK